MLIISLEINLQKPAGLRDLVLVQFFAEMIQPAFQTKEVLNIVTKLEKEKKLNQLGLTFWKKLKPIKNKNLLQRRAQIAQQPTINQ